RRHKVEHTGKNVYAALLDLENWRFTREEEYLLRAKAAVLRAVDLLGEDPEAFEPSERSRCEEALTLHVDGYLRHAAREKGITAQRLWAGTGVARAARLLRRDDWAADALAGCALALDELAEDG